TLIVYKYPQHSYILLKHRKPRYGTMLDGHLNREPAADLAVVDAQRANLSLALGNSNVTRSIVSHQYDIVVEINRIVLREGTTPSETIHDLHGLSVLDFVFAGHG